MRAVNNKQLIAESDNTLVVEGNHYFPPGSVKKEFLTGYEEAKDFVGSIQKVKEITLLQSASDDNAFFQNTFWISK